jgi:CRISPR-associated endonuclease/helicase Cas3
VVLLSEDADGALSLWAGDVPHAPMLSQCRLRQSQAARLAELSAAQQTAWAHLIGEYKGLAYCRPWIVADDPGCYYDPQRGLLFDRASVDARKNA